MSGETLVTARNDRVAIGAQVSPAEGRALVLGASFMTLVAAIAIAYIAFGGLIRASNVTEAWGSPELDYFAGVISALVIAILLVHAPLPSAHRAALLILWAAKTATTLGLMLIYEAQYQTLDAYAYHEQAVDASRQFSELRWGDGTEVVVWLLQLIYALVPPSYHLSKVLFSFIGLIGIYLTWRAAVLFIKAEQVRHLLLVGLFPSLLFWSSILGKDPILVCLVGLFTLGVARLQQHRYASAFLLAFSAAILASLLRLWMGAILTVPALAVFLVWSTGARKPTTLILAAASTAVTVLLAAAAIEMFGGDTAALLTSIDDVSRSWEEGGAGQQVPELGSLANLIAFSPLGAFTALFRPLPGEVGGPFGLAAGVENLFLVAVFAFSLSKLRRRHLLNPSFLILVAVLFTWAVMYGFVSYQNLGTASRFKAQILPILLLLMLCLWHGQGKVKR